MRTELQQRFRDHEITRGLNEVAIWSQKGDVEFPQILQEIYRKIEKGEQVKIADFCCGVGVLAEELAVLLKIMEKNLEVRDRIFVLGVDINPLHESELDLGKAHQRAFNFAEMIGLNTFTSYGRPEWFGREAQASFSTANLEAQEVAIPDTDFNYIFSLAGIPYMANKLQFLANVNAFLKQGGRGLLYGINNRLISTINTMSGKMRYLDALIENLRGWKINEDTILQIRGMGGDIDLFPGIDPQNFATFKHIELPENPFHGAMLSTVYLEHKGQPIDPSTARLMICRLLARPF